MWFFRYLPFHSSDSGRIWHSRKAIHQENSTPYITRSLEQNSLRTSDNTGIAPPGHIDGYWHLPYGEFPTQPPHPPPTHPPLTPNTLPQPPAPPSPHKTAPPHPRTTPTPLPPFPLPSRPPHPLPA